MKAKSTSRMFGSRNKNTKVSEVKLEDQIDAAWKDYSLDAPRIPNPIPGHTRGLRRICLVIHLALPISKIILGATNVHNCMTNYWLPTYMLVGGLLQLAFLVAFMYKPLRQPIVLSVIGIAILLWMFTASVNIIVEWKPDFFPGGWRYCNKALFYFAFFVSISEYIIVAVLLLYVCTTFAYSDQPASTPAEVV